MPAKTIYVANDDQEIFDKAQRLANENISAVIACALKEFVFRKESQIKGLKEVTVHVGPKGVQSEKRFYGRQVVKWQGFSIDKKYWLDTKVYRTARGQWAIELKRYSHSDSCSWKAWMKDSSNYTEDTQFIIAKTPKDAEDKLPPELVEIITNVANQDEAPIEYLDI